MFSPWEEGRDKHLPELSSLKLFAQHVLMLKKNFKKLKKEVLDAQERKWGYSYGKQNH